MLVNQSLKRFAREDVIIRMCINLVVRVTGLHPKVKLLSTSTNFVQNMCAGIWQSWGRRTLTDVIKPRKKNINVNAN